jgi:hypothetical protein
MPMPNWSKLVWVEIGSQPLADAHAMTKNVLAELDRRLATGPAAPRRAGAVLPFLRRQDAEGRAGGVRPRALLVIASLSAVIASAAKQSIYPRAETWIASLRSQ